MLQFDSEEKGSMANSNSNAKNQSKIISTEMTQDFLRYYSLNQGQIRGFIGAFFRNSADIDEVLQETAIVLWNKFGEFAPGTNFFRWACSVARFEALKHIRLSTRKTSALPLDQALIETLASQRENSQPYFDAHRDALQNCLGKLRQQDLELIQQCYQSGVNVTTIAERINRPVNAVYQSLSRIRRLLYECVSRTLKSTEA
jgi:RNA polymerase sigma-70 factor, ECF subfamily